MILYMFEKFYASRFASRVCDVIYVFIFFCRANFKTLINGDVGKARHLVQFLKLVTNLKKSLELSSDI